jgi:hypothetical protein
MCGDVERARRGPAIPEIKVNRKLVVLTLGFSYQLFRTSIDLHQDPHMKIAILVCNSGMTKDEVEVIPSANMIPSKVARSIRT